MRKPVLSIIVPVWNAEKTLSRVVEKILRQDFKDFELILIDDGSTDGSGDIITRFAKADKRVKPITQANTGPAGARNAGLSHIQGQYVMFIDADDDFEPELFTVMTHEIKTKKSDLVVCSYTRDETKNGETIREVQALAPHQINGEKHDMIAKILKSLGESGALYNIWGKIYRTDIIRANHLTMQTGLRFGEDLLFNLDYYKHAKKIDFISDILFHYSVGTGEFSRNALNWEFRELNRKGLENFVGETGSAEILELENWVLYRWMISFALLLATSPLSHRRRVALARKLRNEVLVRANSPKYIGGNKLHTEKIFDPLRRRPRLLLIVFYFASRAKNWRVTRGLLQKVCG